MTDQTNIPPTAARRLRRPLWLTRAGMLAENATRAFWPFWSVVLVVLALLMLGAQDSAPLEAAWAGAVVLALAALAALIWGIRAFRWPTAAEAIERLDSRLPGRPITALADTQAIGAGDTASEAVWNAHLQRMEDRAAKAKAAAPDLKISGRDPYALRYVAVLAFAVALIFGSVWRVATVSEIAPGAGAALASGPTWEGWVEPPAYTGKPSLYLNDITAAAFDVPIGSRITIQLYGEVGGLTVAETLSARVGEVPPASEPSQSFDVVQDGTLSIDGTGGRSWDISVIADTAPVVEIAEEMERTIAGELRQPFTARDDYGVVAGDAVIALDQARLDRRHGLTLDPEPVEPIALDLPMPFTGDRSEFDEVMIEGFEDHRWAGLPVTITMTVEDAAGHIGQTEILGNVLPGRRFFDPMAKALIEQRRDLFWNRENAPRIVQILRATSHRPEGFFRSETSYLMLRVAIRRLNLATEIQSPITYEARDEAADALWRIAVLIEDGNLSSALERLRRAQDKLSEAARNGATDPEIAELMEELRQAMQDYIRQLAEQAQDGENQQAQNNQGETQEVTQDQLQQMLDRIQELMEQGRMDEAQALLDQLREMMENMQVAEGQQGQGQSQGEQAMEGLAETLREQQGLSDEAFRDLQEQFNPNAQAGQSGQNEGRNGGQGRGESHEGQGGQGQGDNQQAEGGGGDQAGDLADRQQALRDQLNRQQQNLPGAGTPEGDAAREALDRAGEAMDGAEDALRQDDFAEALDQQSQAMEALREGMRNLSEQMAQQQRQGQQGDSQGQVASPTENDPLGRQPGARGRIGTNEDLLQGEDVYRRARELLDEIRRRSGEQSRPEAELDYLKRLLDRF
ncbi:MAG: TIGR02302 family protein [Rhodobacteraceae bacterium]|nr:TIGR02302 family protein [Paracoccaceae bacterium]